MEWR